MQKKHSKISLLSLIALIFNLLVIAGGVWVRSSNSGAGCGRFWPLCHNNIIPDLTSLNTKIEFFHRITSGLALILVILLFYHAAIRKIAGKITAKFASWSLFFVIVEALLGAGLVLLRLVENDSSTLRIIFGNIHLINTLLLIAFLCLTYWSCRFPEYSINLKTFFRKKSDALALISIVIICSLGANAALYDTLMNNKIIIDNSVLHHLRNLHPLVAILTTIYLFWWSGMTLEKTYSYKLSTLVKSLWFLLIAQTLCGIVNIILEIPILIQIAHIILADLIWLLAILIIITAQKSKKLAVVVNK